MALITKTERKLLIADQRRFVDEMNVSQSNSQLCVMLSEFDSIFSVISSVIAAGMLAQTLWST